MSEEQTREQQAYLDVMLAIMKFIGGETSSVPVFNTMGAWMGIHGEDARERHDKFDRLIELVEGFDARIQKLEDR